MADLHSTEFNYRFAAGVKLNQQPNACVGDYANYTGTPSNNDDTIKMLILPAYYKVHSLTLQYDAILGTSGTFDLGLYEFDSKTGAIGTVVDADCYMAGLDATANDVHIFGSDTVAGRSAETAERAIVLTLSGAGVAQAGSVEITALFMSTALP